MAAPLRQRSSITLLRFHTLDGQPVSESDRRLDSRVSAEAEVRSIEIDLTELESDHPWGPSVPRSWTPEESGTRFRAPPERRDETVRFAARGVRPEDMLAVPTQIGPATSLSAEPTRVASGADMEAILAGEPTRIASNDSLEVLLGPERADLIELLSSEIEILE